MADDEYAEEEYVEDAGEQDVGQIAEDKGKEVSDLLEGGKTIDGMVAAVTEPPIDTKDAEIKSKYFAIVLRGFQAMRDADIDKLMAKLDQEQREVLLKYAYRGLQEAECCGLLLKMHAKIVEKDGAGAIVRVLTARRTV